MTRHDSTRHDSMRPLPTRGGSAFTRAFVHAAVCAALLSCFLVQLSHAQANPVERLFPESKTTVEKALKQLQPSMSGRLPALEGFAMVGDHPLTRYQRAFYQCTAQVSAIPSGGSVVRVSAKVTAWYADANASHSGYQLLISNGRLESDLLDQLSDQLSKASLARGERSENGSATKNSTPMSQPRLATAPAQPTATEESLPSAPVPSSTENTAALSRSGGNHLPPPPLPAPELPGAKSPSKEAIDPQTEAATLEEVLKNQARPKNLVAIKKSGTPVVSSPSLTAKPLFFASAQDEFEMLDFNADWVHVRISGLSRGWIWRTSLEMPENIPDVPRAVATAPPTAADLFQVSREETAQFPGDWEPLRGKNVKIISVQKIRENDQEGGPRAKLEFAKSVLDKSYGELAKSPDLAGLVLIFDAVDGGMIAATAPTIQRWKAGTLTDAALWHQCYFDPPETFSVSSASVSR